MKSVDPKIIYRIEDCFACEYTSQNVTDNGIVINFSLGHELDNVLIKFYFSNKDKHELSVGACIPSMDKHEIVYTLDWSDYNVEGVDDDLILSTIQARTFAFVENWIDKKDFINLMAWVKSTGYSSTSLLKKIKDFTEKNL